MSHRLEFGVYPLGVAGTPNGLAAGPPDDHGRIRAALDDLGAVVPRTYLVDTDGGGEQAVLDLADAYRRRGLLGHVTLGCLRDHGFAADRWTDLVRTLVERHADVLHSVQITNEPNLAFMDGAKPYVVEALVEGVVAAKAAATAHGRAESLPIGFGSVPDGPAALPRFWADLAGAGAPFRHAVDFVGHNFYVDVFEPPVEPADVAGRVDGVLRALRTRHLPTAGMAPAVPIRVTENGWPTGTNPRTGQHRSYEDQARVLETVVRAVHSCAPELGVTHYVLFGLRDADSQQPDLFHQFGVLRDDYSPKPAYATFKALVAELGAPVGRHR